MILIETADVFDKIYVLAPLCRASVHSCGFTSSTAGEKSAPACGLQGPTRSPSVETKQCSHQTGGLEVVHVLLLYFFEITECNSSLIIVHGPTCLWNLSPGWRAILFCWEPFTVMRQGPSHLLFFKGVFSTSAFFFLSQNSSVTAPEGTAQPIVSITPSVRQSQLQNFCALPDTFVPLSLCHYIVACYPNRHLCRSALFSPSLLISRVKQPKSLTTHQVLEEAKWCHCYIRGNGTG